ncbi:hypothetical protein GGS20DRAFT_526616 [Poronia punctata]|nr:hypothetical protein GGS20DRAFT_526616 [Poronia punctata]
MDQDSRTDESRERAQSSEPSSTRPNPFDDGDQSARKRRRTSLSGSRSTSVETTSISQDPTTEATGVHDMNDMKIDTPEPNIPSTPARPEHSTEPVSSKVTLNLRNAGSLDATPTSPGSPTPLRSNAGGVLASVEEFDEFAAGMSPEPPADDVSSSSSALDSPEEAAISVEELEDVRFSTGTVQPVMSKYDVNSIIAQFPYRYEDEPAHDTVVRLLNYFRQQPGNVDEAVPSLHSWLNHCLEFARAEFRGAITDLYMENRAFWNIFPDLFYHLYPRLNYSKSHEVRDVIARLLAQFAKLTAFLLATDIQTLSQGAKTEETFAALMSPNYIRTLASFTHPDDPYIINGPDRIPDVSDPFTTFQSAPGGSLDVIVSFIEYHTDALAQAPRRIMGHLAASCYLAHSILKESAQKPAYALGASPDATERPPVNMAMGYKCFTLLSGAIDTVIEKFTNNLPQDHATNLITFTSEILKYALQSTTPQAVQHIQQYTEAHPQLPQPFVCEAIVIEWRLQIYCKLIRSRQMQLRVSGAAAMCDDLVVQWKRCQDQPQDMLDDSQPDSRFLNHIAGFIIGAGIVDYILGPTCHPEITIQSGNIVAFLGVTKTYTKSHTDLLWQTLTSTQDPRVAEALVRMMGKITNLFQYEDVTYLLNKFQHVPVGSFAPIMRELFDNITDYLARAARQPPPNASYEICVQLLRESSVFTEQGSIAYPDIYQLAMSNLKRLLIVGPDEEGRTNLTSSCLSDVASKSKSSSGSLQVLAMLPSIQMGLHTLVEQHGFIPLLVADFEAAVQSAKALGVASVYANPFCQARRKFISNVIAHFGSSIDADLGRRLWDHLVGDKAIGQEDRKAAWADLNEALKRRRDENPFLTNCLQLFLPELPPWCYCTGSLEFVREMVVPAADDSNGIALDEEGELHLHSIPIELLWQMILTAPDKAIADSAISTLVNEIYVNSRTILSYPIERARKVHFRLLQRCLSQLKSAAQDINTSGAGTTSGDCEVMEMVVDGDDQRLREELRFTRTLKVLTTLSNAVQRESHFAAPDMRSLMLSSPNAVEGELAGLKYQSFDGNDHSEVKDLQIGLRNSAASLLASLRESTGFENYRLYYRGTTFTPSDANICKSLEELDMKNGLILVKREPDIDASPMRVKPGASALEIEILRHFDELWEYLSMEEKLARGIYEFLVSLPANDRTLRAFENVDTSPRDIFPLGQPFKSLYAIHALREYLNTRRLKSSVMHSSAQGTGSSGPSSADRHDAVTKALSLLIAGICDSAVVDQCPNWDIRLRLALELVDYFVQLLKETTEPTKLSPLLTPALYERLSDILTSSVNAETSELSIQLVHRCFEALLECCRWSAEFWDTLRKQETMPETIHALLLRDDRSLVRNNIAKLLISESLLVNSGLGADGIDFAEYLWPIIMSLLPGAVLEPQKCEELFRLALHVLKRLIEEDSSTLDLKSCVQRTAKLLSLHASTEDIARIEAVDRVAFGLISLLETGVKQMISAGQAGELSTALTRRLFSRHLFPPEDGPGPLVPHAIVYPRSREMLYNVVYMLAHSHSPHMDLILQYLNRLVEHEGEGIGEAYKYELPQSFERNNAIRSSCGYPGLRNLSNTCYLNSLFTQLYMNIRFRRFVLGARISNSRDQQLLSETQSLFANLQDSRRRFVDPQGCVDQITTYEELPIDIHNQMDVDEFYNLLFDRWEGQFTRESDKKALRSIYGGQLVQQVKSQECEHISERIEPFSAIQCDIKGKSGLEESLQAYVDGEIMEGDNKYKCSTCDRHVNAVKRACLKDLPDNLIFHLKRFDFNLRLLQRSKINDYFPFPERIDMQPYTVDHLSNPSGSAKTDVFELVGILVHSGTAETGHYYSYVRERPQASSTPSWVEFNDDVVTTWDPSLMENACFGGPDYRPHDGANVYEKVYSAYMLFYERSSSLRQGQAMLEESGNPRQLRVGIPPELEYQVKLDNWAILQRHNLYGGCHMTFVQNIVEACWSTRCASDPGEHARTNLVMHMALGHLDQVASRTKDLPYFDPLSNAITAACRRCSLCCHALTTYFYQQKEAGRMMLFKNIDASVRQEIGHTYLVALKKIKEEYPDEYDRTEYTTYSPDDLTEIEPMTISDPTAAETAVAVFRYIWDTFHTRTVAWPEYFGIMHEFAKLGPLECGMLIGRGFLHRVLMALVADQALDMPLQYQKLVAVVSRRMATRPPNYQNMIALAETLIEAVDPEMQHYVEDDVDRVAMARRNETIPFTAPEVNVLLKIWPHNRSSVFADKLIQLNQNPKSTDGIITRLVAANEAFDAVMRYTLCESITGQLTTHPVTPYLRAALMYCTATRSKQSAISIVRHVTFQCRNIQNGEGRSFFDFQKGVYTVLPTTGDGGEADGTIELECLRDIPHWVPGVIGSVDRTGSAAVEAYLRDKIFKYGPTPEPEEASGGSGRAQTMVDTARHLAFNVLYHLRDTYVVREAPVPRETMLPFQRIIQQCEPYFTDREDLEQEFRLQYDELRTSVMRHMNVLTVDEIEEDGSDWDHSVASSGESLADFNNIPGDQEILEGGM